VDIAYQLGKMAVPIADNGLVAIPEEMAMLSHGAWEAQGSISDRAKEHLGESDRGIIMFRKLLREQIQTVQNGGDPIGSNMDPNKDEVIQLIHEGYSAFSFAAERAAREGQQA
jgi:hypothetical protein